MSSKSDDASDVVVAPLRNRYFHSPYGRPSTANAWDVRDASATPEAECDYFRNVFLELERSSAVEGLTFLVTSSVRTVPITGDDVVVLVLHDEWARNPSFSAEVLAVLKCYGSRPWFPWSAFPRPSTYAAASLANHARVRLKGIQHTAGSYGYRRHRGRSNVHAVPLGWFKQVEVPWVQYADRPYDASFVGSVAHDMHLGGVFKRTVKRVLGNPKMLSRRGMLHAVENLGAQQPEWVVRVEVSGDFHDVGQDQATAYSRLMMSSKVSLAPRGTSLETFRFFEAIRFGTVPVCEPLPRRWFYDGAPVPTVRSWSELPDVLGDLLADEARQQEIHQECLTWWNGRCAPPAVAERVDEWLRRRLDEVSKPALEGRGRG